MRALLRGLTRPRRFRLPAGVVVLATASTVAIGSLAAGVAAQDRDPNLPGNVVRPSISGLQEGQTLTASVGSWSSKTPLGYFIQWVRSDGNGHWFPIAGANRPTYTLTSADVGWQLFVQVKAENNTGPTWVNSFTTSFVTSPAQAAGAAKLPSGQVSIPVTAVVLPDRLLLRSFAFSPTTIRPGGSVVARFHVTDSLGHAVLGAVVSIVGLPFGALESLSQQTTNVEGVATFQIRGTKLLERAAGGAVAVFVRAHKPGEDRNAGVSAARLVKLPLAAAGSAT